MAWQAAAIAAGAAIVGGMQRNSANNNMSQRQMDFQKNMAQSGYQHSMNDMRAAGLNPILAGKLGPAPTPGGSMPVMHDVLTPAVNTAMAYQQTEADVNLKEANTALTNAKTTLSETLIPGAEAVAVITTQVSNLLQALTSLFGQEKAGYTDMIQNIDETLGDLFMEAKKQGASLNQLLTPIRDLASQASGATKRYLDDVSRRLKELFPGFPGNESGSIDPSLFQSVE